MLPLMADAYDDARAIEDLLYTYADRIDAGDLDGVAELFTHGRVHGEEDPAPDHRFEGREAVRDFYQRAVRLYPDGTPRTKHLVVNARAGGRHRR